MSPKFGKNGQPSDNGGNGFQPSTQPEVEEALHFARKREQLVWGSGDEHEKAHAEVERLEKLLSGTPKVEGHPLGEGVVQTAASVSIGAPITLEPQRSPGALGSDNEMVWTDAATSLRTFRDAVKASESRVRYAATAKALRQIESELPTSTLVAALEDVSMNVRYEAVRTLGERLDASVIPNLIAVVGDREEFIRKAAIKSLVQFGDAVAIPALIEALKSHGRAWDPAARVGKGNWWEGCDAAAKALGELGVSELGEAFVDNPGIDSDVDRGRANLRRQASIQEWSGTIHWLSTQYTFDGRPRATLTLNKADQAGPALTIRADDALAVWVTATLRNTVGGWAGKVVEIEADGTFNHRGEKRRIAATFLKIGGRSSFVQSPHPDW